MRNLFSRLLLALILIGLAPVAAAQDMIARGQAAQVAGLLNNLAVAQPFETTLQREGFQATNTSVRGDNATAAYTVGQSLGGYQPPPGHAMYINSITCTSTKDVSIWVQRANSALIANGAVSALYPILVGPTYGGTVSIPIDDVLGEGETISYVLRTAVPAAASSSAPDFAFACGFQGRRITNDFDYAAPKVALFIGDSIINTTGPTYGAEFFDFQIKRWFAAQGRRYRIVRKGDGGWATSHAFIAMQRGVLNIPQADLIFFMLGTNESSLANFQANFPAFLSWKQAFYPKARMMVLGSPPRQDANETNVLQPIRAYESSTVAALGDPLIRFCSLASAFNPSSDANFITNDSTSTGARVHPNASGHAGMAIGAEGCLTAAGWIS